MSQYEIAIAALLAAQASTLYLLWASEKNSRRWQAIWTRDASELLQWKRYGLMRDPLTGKYRKKDKR